MKHPEFRAVTKDKHILFNLSDCFAKMSELDVDDYDDLLDWIASGNNPDRFTGLCDSEGVPIYENDTVEFTYWWFDGNVAESLLSGKIIYDPDLMSWALEGIKNADWLRHIGDEDGADTTAFAFFRCVEEDFRVTGNAHTAPDTGGEG